MPGCQISIEFYRPDRAWNAGETVSGWVRVEVDRNVRCRNLHLAARWATSGCGPVTSQVYFQTSLFEGVWKPDARYEYPFEFVPPPGPWSWQGQFFELQHLVSVWADLPWTIETRCEMPFQYLPGRTGSAPLQDEPVPVLSDESGWMGARWGRVLATSTASTLLLAATVLIWQAAWWGVFLAFIALALAGISFWRKIARKALPGLEWKVPRNISPGETCSVFVDTGPVRWTRIASVQLELLGKEIVHSEDDRALRRCEAMLHRGVESIQAPRDRPRSEGWKGWIQIQVPAIQAWSLGLPGTRVIWTLRLTFRFIAWPGVTETCEVLLVPGEMPARAQPQDATGTENP